ncbi:putative argininosuccinate synthase [Seiridium unicorne]|uniref:argininosuccinate synthase n=1 Tax=Seiridium unicorne TaxID=138068 RepID=A0ABR2VGL2_9PEZI
MSKGRVCLAYSGGLDTSTILKWLIQQGYTVVCFLANVGQEEDWAAVEKKALALGAERMIIDVNTTPVSTFLAPIVLLNGSLIFKLSSWTRSSTEQSSATQSTRIDVRISSPTTPDINADSMLDLLGTSLARPIIAKAQVKAALENKCDFVSHGCTGKGNDQVRFELAFAALNPKLKVIAPWRLPEFFNKFQSVSKHCPIQITLFARDWELRLPTLAIRPEQISHLRDLGRADLLKYAAENNIPVSSTPKAPWSMDDNLVHCSYEAGVLEDPELTPPKELWTRTVDPLDAPDKPTEFTIHFKAGIPVKVDISGKEVTGSLEIFKLLNKIGHDNGVGRIDIVENRFIGLKSRGCYDTPGLTIARLAHIDLEGLVLDARVRELRDLFVTSSWSRLLYNGLYFSPEREFLDNSIVYSSRNTTGVVKMMAYKGNAYVLGRSSNASNLYSAEDASMDSLEGFSPQDTSGFIAINAIRLKKYGEQAIKDGKNLADL